VNEVLGMDVVILGSNGYQPGPDQWATLMVHPGSRGQYVHALDLTSTATQRLDSRAEGSCSTRACHDPEFDKVVTEWEAGFKARQADEMR
jgi:hypothetical protein